MQNVCWFGIPTYNKVQEEWLTIMENVPLNEKLTLFYYYFQQLMENQNVPIEMWNINNHRLRTNKATKELQTKHHYRKATV